MSNSSKSRNSLVSFVRNYREEARQESMKQRRKQAFQPMLDDKLEDRRLMAVTASVSANKLTVLMDPTDTATISFSSGQLNIGGVSIANGVDSFNTIDFSLNNATNNSGAPSVVFSGTETISGTGFQSLSSITTTNSNTRGWIFRLDQQLDLTSSPTINTNGTTVSVNSPTASSGSINQSVML